MKSTQCRTEFVSLQHHMLVFSVMVWWQVCQSAASYVSLSLWWCDGKFVSLQHHMLVFSVMVEMVWWQVCQSTASYVSLLCDGGNGVMASLSWCVSPSSDRGNHATDGASSWVCRDPWNFLWDDWGWCQGFRQQADQTPQRLCYLQWWVLRSAIHIEAP